jgi:lysophospholipase L1-like esterase
MGDFGKRMGLISLSLLIAAVLAEGLVRVAWDNPFRQESTDHLVTLQMHHANRDLPVDRRQLRPDSPVGRIRTDGRSYIQPSNMIEDPDVKIVFLGGSTTECGALDEEKRFPALVGEMLRDQGIRALTLNVSRAGNTVHDSLNVLLNHVVEDEPDVVVMMHAANDIGVLSRDGSYDSRNGGASTMQVAARWFLQAASRRSDLAGVLRWVVTIQPPPGGGFDERADIPRESANISGEPFSARVRAFIGVARGFGIEPVLMTQPAISVRAAGMPDWIDARNQEIFNQLIREVAQAEDVVLVDLAAHVVTEVESWNEPDVVFYDGIHVSAAGSRIYAEYITRRLLETGLATPRAFAAQRF